MEKKNNWKIGFWIVLGILLVLSFYLFYIIGTQAETIDYFCELGNDAIDIINTQGELISYYDSEIVTEPIEKFECYLY